MTEPITLETADGVSLEAEVFSVAAPTMTAVICHPHPLYGGNMHSHVVGGLFTALAEAGVEAVRFNFRGAGASAGEHGDGTSEKADVEAAVELMTERHPDLPVLVCGYSFGADVSLAVTHRNIAGWFAVAPPLRVIPLEDMAAGSDERPKLIATGSADDFRPPDQLPDVIGGWQNHRVVVVDGANHFFAVGMDVVAQAAIEFAGGLRDWECVDLGKRDTTKDRD